MNYQKAELPSGAVLAGSTPTLTEETILPGILANHMAPRGKCGRLVVEEGACRFVWEDDPDNPPTSSRRASPAGDGFSA